MVFISNGIKRYGKVYEVLSSIKHGDFMKVYSYDKCLGFNCDELEYDSETETCSNCGSPTCAAMVEYTPLLIF